MRGFFWAAIIAFLVDQFSKYVVIHAMDLARVRAIDVFPPLVNFRYGENRGINFGLGGDMSQWALIALAIVICLAVTIWIMRRPQGIWAQMSAGLLVGGALANVVDRLIYGYVLDFLNTTCCGIDNPFVYNIADVFIFAGAIGLIFFTKEADQGGKSARPRKPSQKGQ
ncbi:MULTISPECIES: signal peptidase II [unclassified Sulfitobacter]|uniref:signal peptidase II n=1 Tax=unclassified Sulfitobacter TaxID=196795 RepID=UPI0007C2B96F|nr:MULTISPECIES: signal peptidase II [unclassified Sulfitobacter]KZY06504.1 signal peptidase II [Sulfitobacter sp. HI0023]KZY26094.1 signal peptidase II [Sulfitobacter sp. HI0040]KZZ69531.1 signal peptidase II [Sulfitobacter sp. HI0129]